MSGTSNKAALTEMFRDNFSARTIDRIVGRPMHATVRHPTEQMVPICAAFDTTQWGRHHGSLKMVLIVAKYRAVFGDSKMPINPMSSPAAMATFGSKDNDTAKEAVQKANSTLWQEFGL